MRFVIRSRKLVSSKFTILPSLLIGPNMLKLSSGEKRRSRPQARMRVLRLDAVPEPVRARRRARLVPQRLGQPPGMRVLGVGRGLVTVGDMLGQVLGLMANSP